MGGTACDSLLSCIVPAKSSSSKSSAVSAKERSFKPKVISAGTCCYTYILSWMLSCFHIQVVVFLYQLVHHELKVYQLSIRVQSRMVCYQVSHNSACLFGCSFSDCEEFQF